MVKIWRMWAVIILVTLAQIWPVFAQLAAGLVISELQTGASDSAGAEFVELYNPTDEPVLLDGWLIEYKSATSASNWLRRAELSGEIPAHGFYLIATDDFMNSDALLSSGMAQAGGHLRVVDSAAAVVDLVGWGSANSPEGQPAAVAAAGESIERWPGSAAEEGGNGYDTNDNSADFAIRTSPQPQNHISPPEVPPADFVPPAPPPEPDPLALNLTELFIDPATPLTDSEDEFVELFNPTSEVADLAGYIVQTGKDFSDQYVLPEQELAPGQYLAIYAVDSNLSLANSGGAARLLAPDGSIVAEAGHYTKAKPGDSWASFASGWRWTQEPTPGAPNRLVEAAAPAAKAKSVKAKKPRKASRASLARVATAGAARDAKAAAAAREADRNSQLLLLGLGGLTIAYAAYEFRYDLQNYYRLARRKLGLGN